MNQPSNKRFDHVSGSTTFRNIVQSFNLDQKEVLDIGCSFGEHLIHFGKGSVGITIAKDEAEYGVKEGLDIRCRNVEDKDFSLEKKFDAIFCNNLLEHLYSPHDFLIRMRTFLKPKGMLILGVPCIPKLVFLLRFGKFRGSLAGAHINFFTRDTLTKTVEKGGWTPVAVRGFHLMHPRVDALLNLIYPHFYVVATVDEQFKYTEKRMKELAGYANIPRI